MQYLCDRLRYAPRSPLLSRLPDAALRSEFAASSITKPSDAIASAIYIFLEEFS
jgi:hypothetical protein